MVTALPLQSRCVAGCSCLAHVSWCRSRAAAHLLLARAQLLHQGGGQMLLPDFKAKVRVRAQRRALQQLTCCAAGGGVAGAGC